MKSGKTVAMLAGVVALVPVAYFAAFFPLASLEVRSSSSIGLLRLYRPLPKAVRLKLLFLWERAADPAYEDLEDVRSELQLLSAFHGVER